VNYFLVLIDLHQSASVCSKWASTQVSYAD